MPQLFIRIIVLSLGYRGDEFDKLASSILERV